MPRPYGGIHYPADITAGKAHGERIAGYTLRFAEGTGRNKAATRFPYHRLD